jgi:hypothetical protein
MNIILIRSCASAFGNSSTSASARLHLAAHVSSSAPLMAIYVGHLHTYQQLRQGSHYENCHNGAQPRFLRRPWQNSKEAGNDNSQIYLSSHSSFYEAIKVSLRRLSGWRHPFSRSTFTSYTSKEATVVANAIVAAKLNMGKEKFATPAGPPPS